MNDLEALATDVCTALGWNDASHGKAFDLRYIDLPPLGQIAYERGRLEACNVLSAGMAPPVWKLGESMPMNVFECIRRADKLVGDGASPQARNSRRWRG